MSAELIGILSVGVARLALDWRVSAQLESRLADVDRRLARVEGLLKGLALSGRAEQLGSTAGD